MALNPAFPTDPHAILDPEMRWFPGESELAERGYGKLLPPLVYKVRQGVKTWRDGGYAGACPTTRALLNWWFNREHLLLNPDNTERPFRYYFAQREAVESAIWLYEVKKARDPISLIEFDSSEAISPGMFAGDWTRYVMKMATGTGKTKVMSLLIAWACNRSRTGCFRARPGGHRFSRCAGTANRRAAQTRSRVVESRSRFSSTSGRLFTVVDGNRAVVGLRGMMVDG